MTTCVCRDCARSAYDCRGSRERFGPGTILARGSIHTEGFSGELQNRTSILSYQFGPIALGQLGEIDASEEQARNQVH